MTDRNTSSGIQDVAESMKSQLRKFTGKLLPDATVGEVSISGEFSRAASRVFVGVSTTAKAFATEISQPVSPLGVRSAAIGRPEYVYALNLINTDHVNESADEMLSYLALDNGWDGPNSVAPSKEAIANAYAFIRRLPIQHEAPEPAVYGDGVVGWYWSKGEDVISMVFTGGGRFAYYGSVDGKEVRSPNREYGDAIPYDLTAAISNI